MHSLISLTIVFATAVAAVNAAGRCDVSHAVLPLPPNTTAISAPDPSVAKPKYITVGVGVQNYTCTTHGTYTTDAGYQVALAGPSVEHAVDAVLSAAGYRLGDHYFVPSPSGTGISPKFDFAHTLGDPNAYVVAARAGSIPAPTGPQDIDWLELTQVQGSLAKYASRKPV
ncbi:hypothetical protein EXIGLDRAFT_706115 [Exidia glandulosa HHB12029]|uniref:Uncharacterized protein n=1 Tax=Exidia glandulosa HHB12029 TaxID=1314781 RepID=A0A165KBV1_EXIGL|nr:hypothetical protein EXIGLDRAFT_706115 [Exidia glandulosa HHB12029]